MSQFLEVIEWFDESGREMSTGSPRPVPRKLSLAPGDRSGKSSGGFFQGRQGV